MELFAKGIPQTSHRRPRDIPEIYHRRPRDIPETSQRHAGDVPETSVRHLTDITGSYKNNIGGTLLMHCWGYTHKIIIHYNLTIHKKQIKIFTVPSSFE